MTILFVSVVILGFVTVIIAGWFYCRQFCQQRVAQSQSQRDAELQRFLRRLDHELKNPLTAIRFGLANLTHTTNDATQQKYIQTIEAQILRISELLAHLRKLAELTQMEIDSVPVDVPTLVDEAIVLSREQSEQYATRPVELDCSVAQNVYGDKYLLLLAVYNVLDNAFKFTPDGRRISVQAYDAASQIVIQVIDEGPGIPENDIEHVWEELYRGQTAQYAPGSGIGLALVKAIIEKHGGYIAIKSVESTGTTVSLVLPAAPAQH
jgi:two-component system OmpR family sensor kinase